MAKVDTHMIERLIELRTPAHPDPVAEVLGVFEVDGEQVVERIEQAFAVQDAELLRRAAHRLKGAAANVGAADLAILCDAIERCARGGGVDCASANVGRLSTLFRDSVSALQAFRRTTGSATPSA